MISASTNQRHLLVGLWIAPLYTNQKNLWKIREGGNKQFLYNKEFEMKRKISNFEECVREIKEHALWELDIPTLKKKKWVGDIYNRGFYVLCPFHKETSASLLVHREWFYCFGCQKVGSIIDFYMLTKKVSFFKAVVDLCALFKIKTKWEK